MTLYKIWKGNKETMTPKLTARNVLEELMFSYSRGVGKVQEGGWYIKLLDETLSALSELLLKEIKELRKETDAYRINSKNKVRIVAHNIIYNGIINEVTAIIKKTLNI